MPSQPVTMLGGTIVMGISMDGASRVMARAIEYCSGIRAFVRARSGEACLPAVIGPADQPSPGGEAGGQSSPGLGHGQPIGGFRIRVRLTLGNDLGELRSEQATKELGPALIPRLGHALQCRGNRLAGLESLGSLDPRRGILLAERGEVTPPQGNEFLIHQGGGCRGGLRTLQPLEEWRNSLPSAPRQGHGDQDQEDRLASRRAALVVTRDQHGSEPGGKVAEPRRVSGS